MSDNHGCSASHLALAKPSDRVRKRRDALRAAPGPGRRAAQVAAADRNDPDLERFLEAALADLDGWKRSPATR